MLASATRLALVVFVHAYGIEAGTSKTLRLQMVSKTPPALKKPTFNGHVYPAIINK